MLFRSVLLLIVLFQAFALPAQPCREVIAFFPSWKWYDRGRLVNPSTIDYSKYTIINYAFFKPHPDGRISPFDPHADKTLLLGKVLPHVPSGYLDQTGLGVKDWHVPGTSLVERAHANDVRVLISIGGWTMSNHFSAIAASDSKRRLFAKSCADLVRMYGVDGVDIDWEYPGFVSTGGAFNDKENFTLLLRAIRQELHFAEVEVGKPLMLTADFGVSRSHMEKIEWDKVTPLLDFVNLMTYDYYGTRPRYTNHHAPLYPPRKGIEGFDLHNSVHYLMDRYGVPSEKINIGLAFFGRSLRTKRKPDIHVPSLQSVDEKTFPEDAGAPSFYNILARQRLFDTHWDEFAQVPYLKGKRSLNTFVTFENERSIALKAHYILDHDLAGAIVWDITGDYVASRYDKRKIERTPLADALNQALCFAKEPSVRIMEKAKIRDLKRLPLKWPYLEKKTFAPRLSYKFTDDKALTKKEKRLKRREERKKKRRRKKQKGEIPNKYFDGGW